MNKVITEIISSSEMSNFIKKAAYDAAIEMLENGKVTESIDQITFDLTARDVRVASVLEPQKYLKTEADKRFVEEFDLFGCKRMQTIVVFEPGTSKIRHGKVVKFF
jgi:hypothetical protein